MIPLTVRSHYSLMWGTASVKQLCRTAKSLGYDRLALTDTDNLYGLWPFLTACHREGLIPIVGAEVTDPKRNTRAVCLVENHEGYTNLCRLLTRRHMDESFNLATAMIDCGRGLVVLTSHSPFLKTWYEAGLCVAGAMPRRPLSRSHELRQTTGRLGIPIVATPSSFFLRSGDVAIHHLLRAIDLTTTRSRLTSGDVAPNDAWLAAPDHYVHRFSICPEAIRATRDIAQRLTFTGPEFGVVLPPWKGDKDADECLRRTAYNGAKRRYGRDLSEPVVDRLEHELRIIGNMGFSAYFLIVRDIVIRSPRTCGRGSGAASLVAYCLDITNVCPVKHNLYFERFLNPDRKDLPDIDVDFAWDERDDVLNAVLDQYQGRAAMVCNHVLFQPRMAVREVAKVYGLTDREIGQVSKRMPWYWRVADPDLDLLTSLKKRPEMKSLDFPDPWPEIFCLAQKIIGTPRYLSVHPGGVVITPDPINDYVPVERAAKGVPIIQWEKDATEDAGLVKIDLLGNRSLAVIRDAVNSVRKNNIVFDERRWEPEDDFATQEALAQGKTMGCFYIESPAMRLLQKKAGIGDFEHLVIHSSIIRPAANEFIREYIRRLHGGEWHPIHPLLADVLDDTFGIMVYQEDVARVAVSLAGFSHSEADAFRKIMSKKDREFRFRDFYSRFYTGARKNGVSKNQIAVVWKMMMSFSGYSFCKPHSASYARVSFQAAYLKVHFPAEFMAAVISNQGGFYSTFAYVSEARRMGLSILPPDIHLSEIHWIGHGSTLRVGLSAIGGLSVKLQMRIISQRRSTPYTDMHDFLDRVRPDDVEARALIHCGALDRFVSQNNRVILVWQLVLWRNFKKKKQTTRSLFNKEPDFTPPSLTPESSGKRLFREFGVLGFLCSCHPLSLYEKVIQKIETVKAMDLSRFIGRRVRMAVWLITGKVVRTKYGHPMEFLTFEDDTGIVETTFFPRTYHRFCHMIDRGQPYILSGKVDQDRGAITLTVDNVAALPRFNE